LRDPRDLAQLIHLSLAANTKLELTGSSLAPTHPKVINIINSWLPGFKNNPNLKLISQRGDFSKRITQLKKKGFVIVGTSSHQGKSLFGSSPLHKEQLAKTSLAQGKHVIVFGTETSGLSEAKLREMDLVLSVPMKNETKFFTLGSIVPVFVYEALRQKKLL